MSSKQEYEFAEDGFFSGTFYKKGRRAHFDPREVRHQKHWIKPVETKPAPKAAGAAKPAKKAE